MDSSELTKFRRNRVASNSHNGQKATNPPNKITQMSSGLLMDLIMGSRKVVHNNTTIFPNCGGTNGAGCNQDLIGEEEDILQPPDDVYSPFWAASVLTDRGEFIPSSITMDGNNNLFAVDLGPQEQRVIHKISYTPSTSTQIAPTGAIPQISEWYTYASWFIPGTIVHLNNYIFTFDYNSDSDLDDPGILLIGKDIASGDISLFTSTLVGCTPPSQINDTLRGSTLTTDGVFIYFFGDPNSIDQPVFRLNPFIGGGLTNPSAAAEQVTPILDSSGQVSSITITGMRVYANRIFYTNTVENKIYSVEMDPITGTSYSIAGGSSILTTPVPAFPSQIPVAANLARFSPSDIEIVELPNGDKKMYIADRQFNRVLILNLINDTDAAANTVSLFAGHDAALNNVNNPPTVTIPPPPAYVLALGQTPAPPINGPPYTLTATNACNLVKPICLYKVPSTIAPFLPSIGNTQIFVGTKNITNGNLHLPLMLLKYYY